MRKYSLIGLLLVLLLLSTGCSMDPNSTLRGTYVVSSEGDHIIIDEQDFPIVMSAAADIGVFDNFHSGDIIEVVHDGIRESYPGQLTASSCRLITPGAIGNVSAQVLEKLESMGWTFEE